MAPWAIGVRNLSAGDARSERSTGAPTGGLLSNIPCDGISVWDTMIRSKQPGRESMTVFVVIEERGGELTVSSVRNYTGCHLRCVDHRELHE